MVDGAKAQAGHAQRLGILFNHKQKKKAPSGAFFSFIDSCACKILVNALPGIPAYLRSMQDLAEEQLGPLMLRVAEELVWCVDLYH